MSSIVLYDLSNVFLSRGTATYGNGTLRRGGGVPIVDVNFPINNASRKGDYMMYLNATPCLTGVYYWSNGSTSNCDPDDNTIYAYITGWDRVYSWGTTTKTAKTVYNINEGNTVRLSNNYVIYLKNEKTADPFNLTHSNLTKLLMDVKCDDYSHFMVDLLFLKDYNKTYMYLATRQAPSVMITIDALNQTDIHEREIKLFDGDYNINYYLIPSPYLRNIYDFNLLDYSFAYEDSYLKIMEHISDNYDTIFRRDFIQEKIFGVDLIPDYAYDVFVCRNSDNVCYSMGSLTSDGNNTLNLKVTKPYTSGAIYKYNDVQIMFNTNETARTIQLDYYSLRGTPIINISLNIFNVSSNGSLLLDDANPMTDANGTIIYYLPENGSVVAQVLIETTTHGRYVELRPVTFGRNTYDTSAFNITGMPGTFLGEDKSTLLMFMSFIIILTVMLTVGKVSSLGYGIMAGAFAFEILLIFSWVPTSIPGWIFIIFFIFGVGVKLAESRIEVIG